jgi:predicted phosphodiesterase
MSSWTQEEKQLVLELAGDKLAKEIIVELQKRGFGERTEGAVRGIIRRHGATTKTPKPTKRIEVEEKKEVGKISHKETLNEMESIRRKAINKMAKYDETIGNPKDANFKVLSISDTHIPYYHDKVLNEAINKHKDADVLVLNGDILELHSVSRWPKNKAIALQHEYQIAMKWLGKLHGIFPKIILVKGNHEERLQSHFQANVDPGVSFMTDPDILERLSEGYDFDEYGEFRKMYDLPKVIYNKGQLSWFAQVGKCIFAHPSGSSGVPMRTAIKTAEYFQAREYDFDSLVIGHTHKMGTLIWNNKLLVEQGCACIPMEYEGSSKMAYRPQAFGYSVTYMDQNGNVDFDKSGPVYFGTGTLSPSKVIEIGDK